MKDKNHEIVKRRSQLSPAKQAILEKRLRGESKNQQISIRRRTQQSPCLLSLPQQRLWFIQQLEPQNYAYNEFACIQLKGAVNFVILEKSFNEIIKRHESLRTSFETLDGKPVQVIHPTVTLNLPVVDLRNLPPTLQDAEVEKLTAKIAQKPFELALCPLLRVILLQITEEEYLLLLVVHHIVCDGWSIQLFNQELAEIYEASLTERPSTLTELPIQYADYSIWQQQWLQGEREKAQLSYWKQQLADAPSTLSLPTDRQRSPVQSFKGAVKHFKLSSRLTDMLRSLSKEQGVTLFMTLLAAFQAQLYRYTGQKDICIGSPIANRNHSDTERLIGCFVNTFVLRTDLSGNPSFLELLNRVREICIGAYAHANLPFERLVGELHPERNLSHNPLFQVMFAFQEGNDKDLVLPNLTLKWLQKHSGRALFDLTLNVVDAKSELWGYWEYNTDLFDAATIERMVGHFTTLLEGIVSQLEKRLSDLPLLTEPERQTLLFNWNNTEFKYSQDKCIHELFEAQVEKTPDAIAVVFENQQLTYRELNQKTNQLAHYLRSLGVKPEVLVGICVERSLSMLIGLLAILKAGGAYIPLDPSYPIERIAFILEDTQAPVLLTQSSLVEVIAQHQTQVVCLDTDWHLLAQQNQENSFSQLTTGNLAYTIYTSGSTGKPKGVQIPHIALSNFLHSMKQAPGLNAQDTLLAVTTYSFDIAALELFLPIIVGARLVIANREIVADAIELSAKLLEEKATVMQATPATWQLLLAAGWGGNHQLKILCGGETLGANLANQLLGLCDCLWNMYGPTETTIWSAASQVETVNNTVAISSAIANTQLYILDKYHQLVPVGVIGELCIGGVGLARGYFQRPDLTAEKFIPNPFSDKPARLYRTGDLARYLANGGIEYIGRIDNQVKVRGFRIEMGEIEAIISQHLGVREAVVMVHCSQADSQRIVAYVVPQKQQAPTISQLRGFVEAKLPNYMVPAAFVTLEALPLTPNGKVDRKALPAPELTQISSSNIVPPSTPIENLLAGIWAEILGIDKVGIHDNFFELGGHSLIATRVISQIRQVFQVELPLRCLFEKPTIAGLAEEIEKASKAGLGIETTKIEPIERSQELPLSFAQQRLWFLAQLEPDSPFYNIPAAVRLQGQLNLNALQQSFNEIVRRHEALRTNFQTVEGKPVAIISEATSLVLPLLDLSELPANQQEVEVKHQVSKETQQPFDLTNDVLLRVQLLRLNEQEHIVLLTMHHIVSDGWSIGVLVQELATLYQAFCNGQPSPLAELPIQYVDFAAWQRQCLQAEALETQISYWRKQLENAPEVLELPTDHPRPAIQTFRGATYSFNLSPELSKALDKLSQQQGSTLFMTLLAAFQTLLWRYTGQEDIVIGSPIANRNRAEIEGLIGFFVNTLVLRTNLTGNPSFEELLKRAREVALGAYVNQDLPFELLVEQLRPQRNLSNTPLFQVMFVLQNTPMSALELTGLNLTPLESNSHSAKFDLTLYMSETQSGLVGSLEYNSDLFEESSIHRMVEHLQTLLSKIIANPQQRLCELLLLTEPEKHQLLVEWNNTQSEYPQQQCIHQLFEAQVERIPDAVAVVFEWEQLTYCELNTKVNQLAHYLRSLGVKPEILVGICIERSLDMIIGLLAILKAGGAYVPLDPSYPQERLAFMLSDSQLPILITQQHLKQKLPQQAIQIVCLDSDEFIISQQSQDNPIVSLETDNVAYIIYTSGSTGQPKGVFGLHKGAINRFQWMWQNYPFGEQEICCQKTSLNFVDSVWEIFGPLLKGVTVVIIPDKVVKDPQKFIAVLAENNITRLVVVPSLLAVMLSTPNLQLQLPKLKLWISSGEALSNDLLKQFRQSLPDSTLLNLYGSSEVSADVTCYSITPQTPLSASVLIGRPIANTQIYILDANKQPVPVGLTGEIYVGGEQLARGYLNRPQLTTEKFIPNPFSNKPAARLYKTGDLARYLPTGEIEYIGRIDHQVKIRGFRIETGEIEAKLTQYPDVKEAVVIVREDIPGDKQLVAYVVSEQELKISELRNFLQEKIPDYMIPAAFVSMKALPLTPNGKVDRRSLPIPDNLRPQLETTYIKPQTDLETSIAAVWQKALKIEKVGINDNFFELGGHSLLMVQVHSQLREIVKKDLLILDLFRYPTISSLAEFLSRTNENELSDIDSKARTQQLEAGKARMKQFLKISKGVR